MREIPDVRELWILVAAGAVAVFAGFALRAVEPSSGRDADGWTFLPLVLMQLVTAVLLWFGMPFAGKPSRLSEWMRLTAWGVLPWWYFIAAAFTAAFAGTLIARGEGIIMSALLAVGAYALATTAHYVMLVWEVAPEVRVDMGVFLFATHVLALLAAIAFLATTVEGAGGLARDIANDGTLALTFLALPTCAGVWVRLRALDPPVRMVRSASRRRDWDARRWDREVRPIAFIMMLTLLAVVLSPPAS